MNNIEDVPFYANEAERVLKRFKTVFSFMLYFTWNNGIGSFLTLQVLGV